MRDTALAVHSPPANERHFNDRLKVDISSMRQLVTEAPENPLHGIDGTCFCWSSSTDLTCH